MKATHFNPGCALSIYKPEIEHKLIKFLNENYANLEMHNICCRHDPKLSEGSKVINVCAGCDRRFRSLYEGVTTISLWEVLDSLASFPYPDYKGAEMTVHDPCPIREKPEIHKAVRSLLGKMNINVVETPLHGTRSVCCGDSFYPALPVEEVNERMKKRAGTMPCDDVCVYCVSCIKSMYIGGKKPRHLVDLLMGETTEPGVYDTVRWHKLLKEYIDTH
ncbi:MAG: (Fe-S)-binding protein [Defluviitaleaceae bacterium]|nr:(Fe-S)-binding protein [Defluviitaleaceae bacterium]